MGKKTRQYVGVQSLWWIALGLPPILAMCVVLRFGVNVPYYDDFMLVPTVVRSFSQLLDSGELFRKANEHIVLFPKLVVWTLAQFSHFNLVVIMAASQVCLFGVLVLFYRQWRKDYPLQTRGYYAFLFVPFLLYHLRQSHSFVWAVQLSFFLTILEVVASLFFLVRTIQGNDYWQRDFALALGFGVMASFSHGSGILWGPVGFVTLLAVRPRNQPWKLVSLWAVVWVCTLVAFVTLGNSSPQLLRPSLSLVGKYFAIFLGGALGIGAMEASVLGWVGVGLGLIGVVTIAAFGRLRKTVFWVSLMGFALLNALAAAWMRSYLGVDTAYADRYSSFSILFWIGLTAVLVDIAVSQRSRVLVAGVGLFVLGLGIVQWRVVPFGWRQAKRIQVERQFVARLLLRSEARTDAQLRLAHPNTKAVRNRLRRLRQLHYSLFSESDRWEEPFLGEQKEDGLCRVRLADSSGGLVSVSGWMVDIATQRKGTSLWIRFPRGVIPAEYGHFSGKLGKRFGPYAYRIRFLAWFDASEVQEGDWIDLHLMAHHVPLRSCRVQLSFRTVPGSSRSNRQALLNGLE